MANIIVGAGSGGAECRAHCAASCVGETGKLHGRAWGAASCGGVKRQAVWACVGAASCGCCADACGVAFGAAYVKMPRLAKRPFSGPCLNLGSFQGPRRQAWRPLLQTGARGSRSFTSEIVRRTAPSPAVCLPGGLDDAKSGAGAGRSRRRLRGRPRAGRRASRCRSRGRTRRDAGVGARALSRWRSCSRSTCG